MLPPSAHDVGIVAQRRFRGGLAFTRTIGTRNRYSANGSEVNGDFARATRHELAHSWCVNHFDGGAPEGQTINSGNSLAKFSGPELELVLTHRSESLGVLDDLGTFGVDMPPRAADDRTVVESGRPAFFNPLFNDSDVNGHALSILSFDAQTEGGLAVTRQGNLFVVADPVLPGHDTFSYRVQDSSGMTSTAVCHLRTVFAGDSLGHWNFGGSQTEALDSSARVGHGTLVGDAAIDANGELVLDGNGDYVDLPAPRVVTNTVTYTARVFRAGSQDEGTGILLGGAVRAHQREDTGLRFAASNSLGYRWTGAADYASSLVVPDSQWTFVALVIEPDQATIYMDDGFGMRSEVRVARHSPKLLVDRFQIGHDPFGRAPNPGFFAGRMDDVQMVDRALSAAEIADLAAGGGGARQPNPLQNSAVTTADVALTWESSSIATAERLYVSKDYVAVRDGVPGGSADAGLVSGGQWTLSNVTSGTWFWRVESTEPAGLVRGEIYAFTSTGLPPFVADEVVRLGSPANPAAFVIGATSGPILGQVWDPAIDHDAFAPAAAVDFALFAGAPANVAIPGLASGVLLVDLAPHVALTATPGGRFQLRIPRDRALLGARFYVQGGSLDLSSSPGLLFANAIDITVGETE